MRENDMDIKDLREVYKLLLKRSRRKARKLPIKDISEVTVLCATEEEAKKLFDILRCTLNEINHLESRIYKLEKKE